MKPLETKEQILSLLERIQYAKEAQNLHVSLLSATSIELQLSVQDANRGYDWIDVAFRVDGVSDAKLLDDAALLHVDIDEGISCDKGAIAIGEYKSKERYSDAVFYILGKSLKYEERPSTLT